MTCYLSKENSHRKSIGGEVGIDFGVDSKLTLSNGIKIDFELDETPRLKRLQKKLAKSEKGSKNRRKIRHLLRREYEKIKSRRKDVQNKILAFLKLYEKVVFQEDLVKGWAARFGRQVHASGIGGLKARLRNSLAAPISVDRFEPTSQECYACGKRRKLSLADRVIKCECGWTCDRDVNAAMVILRKGLGLSPDRAVGLDRPELK
ncbi:RNA-guided endonuclease InsQ/TnpB family protein, partial [Hydrogenibacillus schlegelii]|uniref:RNA-guided endonuclease InsQ/TnpB family protein n=1 Tax=Hydrogenibacillus schlegelii TaxID=1484 RepID=UPI001B80606F